MYIIIYQYLRYCIVYVDEKVLPFQGIIPQASVYVLSIPKCRDGLKQLGKVIFFFFFVFFHFISIFLCTGNLQTGATHLTFIFCDWQCGSEITFSTSTYQK